MANENSWAASAASRRATAVKRFWEYVTARWGDEYDFSQFEYLGATTKSTVVCKKHGAFETKPTYLMGGNGCPVCGREKVQLHSTSRLLGAEAFIAKAREVHGSTYDYSEVVYVGSKVKVRIVCPTHGVFEQKPNSHLDGKGCPECSNDKKRARNATVSALVKEGLASRLQSINPNWTFDISSYTGMGEKITGHCALHGAFRSRTGNVLQGRGCPACGDAKHSASMQERMLTTKEWVSRAIAAHKGKYTYDRAVYLGDKQPITVTCPIHGDFESRTDGHVRDANGCPRCSHHLSKGEDAIATMLSRFTPIERRNRALLAPRELDIFMPEKALAVEYCGEYWHSHGDEEHEAQYSMNHFRKYQDCKARGIRLLTIFESEWKEHNYAIRRLLRNAVGASRGKLMARKCELRMVEHKEAAAFYDRYHPQGGSGTGAHYGLYWGDKLVACMRFTEGANDRGVNKKREWTLTRYATRITVSGGASRLFSAFLKDKNPRTVKSFSDNRYFDGGMYSALGFDLFEETKPDYMVWHPKLGLLNKPAWQRRSIVTRAREIGCDIEFDHEADPRTERDMTFLLGGRRIYDCGKKKWVWSR